MSTPFTTATNYTKLSNYVFNELVTAYNEVDQVLNNGASQITTFNQGDSMQALDNGSGDPTNNFWYRMQHQILDGWYSQIVNHVAGPLLADGTDFRYFTLAEFLAAAGLPTDGLRRAQVWDGVNTPTWLTGGPAQNGDIIGPWIIQDLQKIYSTVKWTARGGGGVGSDLPIPSNATEVWEFGYAGSELAPVDLFTPAKAAQFSTHMSNFDSPSYGVDSVGAIVYAVSASYTGHWQVYPPSGGLIVCDQFNLRFIIGRSRSRGKAHISGLPTLSHTADIYLVLNALGAFNDFDGLGLTQDKLNLVESLSASADTEQQQSSYLGDLSTDPAVLAGITVDMNEQITHNGFENTDYHDVGYSTAGCMIGASSWLLKWNFSFSNP